jgi:hypothetical protein
MSDLTNAIYQRGFSEPGEDDPLRDFMATYFEHDDEVTRSQVIDFIDRIIRLSSPDSSWKGFATDPDVIAIQQNALLGRQWSPFDTAEDGDAAHIDTLTDCPDDRTW